MSSTETTSRGGSGTTVPPTRNPTQSGGGGWFVFLGFCLTLVGASTLWTVAAASPSAAGETSLMRVLLVVAAVATTSVLSWLVLRAADDAGGHWVLLLGVLIGLIFLATLWTVAAANAVGGTPLLRALSLVVAVGVTPILTWLVLRTQR
jgi:hypothetical protein